MVERGVWVAEVAGPNPARPNMYERVKYPGPQGQRYGLVRLHPNRMCICEIVTDINGTEYYVTRRHGTLHGWDILYGLPVDRDWGSRPSEIIVTPSLRDHMIARSQVYHSGPIDLPISEMSAVRLRRKLGIKRKTGVRGIRKTKPDRPRQGADLSRPSGRRKDQNMMRSFEQFRDAYRIWRLDGGAMDTTDPGPNEPRTWAIWDEPELAAYLADSGSTMSTREATEAALSAGGLSEEQIAADMRGWTDSKGQQQQDPKVTLAKARLEAAKLRTRAAHQAEQAAGYRRQAQKPIYDGQAEICGSKAADVEAMVAECLARADLIEAEAEAAYRQVAAPDDLALALANEALEWWHTIPAHFSEKEPAWVQKARDFIAREAAQQSPALCRVCGQPSDVGGTLCTTCRNAGKAM